MKLLDQYHGWRKDRAIATLAMTRPSTLANQKPSHLRKVTRALSYLNGQAPHIVKNWYEGGFPLLTGDQSYLNQIVQDARFDQNFVTRREMMRRMRNHAQDVPLHKKGLDVSRQYVIGTHLPVVTSIAKDSTGWCTRAEQVFAEMCESAGLSGESLYQMLCVAHDCKKNDGDILFIKTSKMTKIKARSSTISVARPCYQLAEAHRIETPFNMWNRESVDIIDGVQFKFFDAPIEGTNQTRRVMQRAGYWVKDTLDALSFTSSYAYIPVEASIFVYSPNRVNHVRGISDYYAVETTLHLLRDILKLEMRAQEVQSDFAMFITNVGGQAPMKQSRLAERLAQANVTVAPDGSQITVDQMKRVMAVYEQIMGGKKFFGRTGDTVQPMAPNRPSEATLNLLIYLINSYCIGAKVPRCITFPNFGSKSQGTEVRAELDSSNSAFVSEFNLNWKPVMCEAWRDFIGWAINNDLRVADPPADWQQVEVSPPRSVLVDAGYDSMGTIAELAAGITNMHEIAQGMGTTEDRLIDASVRGVAKLKKACENAKQTYGVEVKPEEVRQSLSEVVKNLATAQASKGPRPVDKEEPVNA